MHNNQTKLKISEAITKNRFTAEQDKFLLANADTTSIKQLAKHLGFDKTAIWRRLQQLGYNHNPELSRAKLVTANQLIGQRPDVKEKLSKAARGRKLTEEHKVKIGAALTGENNGMHGRRLTPEQQQHWADSYQATGYDKMISWLNSPDGYTSRTKAEITTKSKGFREAISAITAKRYQNGFMPHGFVSGYHQSPKAGEIYYQSSYELAYFKQLDNDPTVVEYKTHPFTIPYEFDGYQHNYIPDILINSKILVEIKPESLAQLPKNLVKRQAAEIYCAENDLTYQLITESNLGI